MFKAQVFRRGFSIWRRRVPESQIIRSAIRDGHETIQIQRVRINTPLISRSRMIGTVVTTIGTYQFLRWLDDDEEEEKTDTQVGRHRQGGAQVNTWQQVTADTTFEEDEEDDDVLLFLPTGLSRPKPREYYKGSDPEWQGFLEVSRNPERVRQIRRDFTRTVRGEVARDTQYKRLLGDIEQNKGNVWIDVVFPDGPPLEYERPGIEITDNLEIRRSLQPVQHIHHHQLRNTLMPIAAANAAYMDIKRRFWVAWIKVRRSLGYPVKLDVSDFAYRHALIISQPTASPSPRTTSQVPQHEPTGQSSTLSSTFQQEPQGTSDPSKSILARYAPKLRIDRDMVISGKLFRSIMEQAHSQQQEPPPRGNIILTGMVEVVGSRATITYNVIGHYDVKTGEFQNVKYFHRLARSRKQSPRGGP
ncbi:hypothetical protein BU24DRAFT_240180 [Aaosphaeria arxii CBS 175.79]|uniref:Uncharacterized protein n=1 Tax=Aaosphaeria arxii CBS 175.79 TaxID=1450172 RepID=A0A6A5XKA1_9PLEO|nr:uncharacterized protein BU24DRAFT_240180 [Aaosphaeria arxii CBS 175.79]KAF2013552.1 hypothetical protein BU24DRAFT_240180 [Aaosphaeria arxii CBS 175.79]